MGLLSFFGKIPFHYRQWRLQKANRAVEEGLLKSSLKTKVVSATDELRQKKPWIEVKEPEMSVGGKYASLRVDFQGHHVEVLQFPGGTCNSLYAAKVEQSFPEILKDWLVWKNNQGHPVARGRVESEMELACALEQAALALEPPDPAHF